MSGLCCSAARTLFFEAQPLAVNEVPHRAVIDLEAALGVEFVGQPLQREVARRDPPEQPRPVLALDLRPPMAADLARRRTPGRGEPTQPFDHTRRTHPEPGRHRTPAL